MNRYVTSSVFAWFGVLFCCQGMAGADSGTAAPVNPLFAAYSMNNDQNGGQLQALTRDGRPLNYRPPPVNRAHLARQGPAVVQAIAYPSFYDLRAHGKLTLVKDQGMCGDCWTFATTGSLESALLPGESWDFSENNLKNRSSFDLGSCDGGNADMAAAYLVRWDGPVAEIDDPYEPLPDSSPAGLTVRKHVQEVLYYPDRTSATDNDTIKQAVLDHGALYTIMRWNDGSFNSATNSFYYGGSGEGNHAVAIIGWDDSYDRNRFNLAPPGNGAFIVRNSWGSDWGENGYFYVSYYDAVIGESLVSFNGVEVPGNYATVYQYDFLGQTGTYGFGGATPTTGWFANIFTAITTEDLAAISFVATAPVSAYTITVYRGVTTNPVSGTQVAQQTGSLSLAGYHTIPLDTSVRLVAGQRFSVVVKVTTPGYNDPIPTEGPIPGYSSQATASANQSYVSANGTTWSDLTATEPNTNVCLKAFSRQADVTPPTVTAISPDNNTAGVTVATVVNAVFSEALDASTVTGGTFTLIGPAGKVAGTVSYSGTTATFIPAATLAYGSLYSATLTSGIRDLAGNSLGAKTWNFTTEVQRFSLTSSNSGTGTGRVTSTPVALDCLFSCAVDFPAGTGVTLKATADSGSFFAGWTAPGACGGNGDCLVTMTANTTVTALFQTLMPVQMAGVPPAYYPSIQIAYDMAPLGTATINVRAGDVPGSLFLGRPLSVSLRGGLTTGFESVVGVTGVPAPLTIGLGDVTISDVVVR